MAQPTATKRSLKLDAPFLLLLLIAIPFLYFRLAEVPYTWYDEGLNVNSARLMATTGLYGLPDFEGPRLGDPAVQSGPPLTFPLAALYQIVGPNLLVMRAWMTFLGLMALCAIYILVIRLYDTFTGFVTILVILMMPGDTTSNFIMLSRQTLGEIPAVLCIALGLRLMLAYDRRWIHVIAAGLLFGVAAILKSQALLILTVTLAIWTFHLYRKKEAERSRRWGAILVCLLLMYGFEAIWNRVVSRGFNTANTATLIEGIFIHIITQRGILNLITPTTIVRLVLVLGTVRLMVVLRRRWKELETTNYQLRVENWLLLFVSIWMIWYAFISIGWARYAFIGMIFAVILISRLFTAFWHRRKWPINWKVYGVMTVIGVIGACIVYLPQYRNTAGDDFFQVVDYVKADVPADARILSWEWSAAFFTSHKYIIPDTHVVNVITRSQSFSRRYPDKIFDPLLKCPDYILLGSFIYDRRVFKPALDVSEPEPLISKGMYELYRVDPNKIERLEDGSCAPKTLSP